VFGVKDTLSKESGKKHADRNSCGIRNDVGPRKHTALGNNGLQKLNR
jgi:hypothetical protein